MFNFLRKLLVTTEIKSKDGLIHFRRWRLLNLGFLRIFIHQIFESDRDLHLHNHPWHFLSFILKGSYFERLSNGTYKFLERFNFCFHKKKEFHKLTLTEKPTITLVLAFGKYEEWGYETKEGYIDSETYRIRKNNKTLPEN